MENNNLDDEKKKLDFEIEIEEEIDYKDYNAEENKVDEEKKANRIGLFSVILLFLPFVILKFFGEVYTSLAINENKRSIVSLVFLLLNLIVRFSIPVSIILMVYLNIKYPKNKFGKVLLFLLGIFIIVCIAYIVYFI